MKNKYNLFLIKSHERHGNKYDYSKVNYIDSKTKVCIICHEKDENGVEHGEFWQTPSAHIRGRGCPKCANGKRGKRTMTTEKLIALCQKKYPNYTYQKTEYNGANKKICVTCKKHGNFYILPYNHIRGQGCPKCKGRNLTQEEVINKFKEIHGNEYDYSKINYVNSKTKVCIICPKHGEFWQTPYKHISGQGCPICGGTSKLSVYDFIKRSERIHNSKYDYAKINYINNKTYVDIICPIHGIFRQTPFNHLNGHGCPKCVSTVSKDENSIYEFIKNIDNSAIQSDKNIICPYELDIYIPDKKVAIEYDGLYWHNEKNVDIQYHLKKTEECEKKGIRLIHIFEDEWLNKEKIVKSRIKNILSSTSYKIYARKCIIKNVDTKECKQFLEENHLQGNCISKYRYGLYYNDELVSLMTFGLKRKALGSISKSNEYELLRFCNKLNTNVIGGASKLLQNFIKMKHPTEIISYCDKRWSNGNLYRKLGFSFVHDSQPNYYYIVGNHRENRFKFRKSELVKQGFDSNKSEHEIMLERGIYRIYDCGTKVYKWERK